jgi:lipopolysaccharide heptosyltransferase II
MRRVDSLAGRAICALLTALRRVPALGRRPRPAPERIERILVMKFWGMGSLVCAAPTFAALRRSFPSARVDLLTFPAQRGAAALLGLADEIVTIDAGSLAAFARSTLAALRAIRARRYDAVVDLEFFSKFTMILSSLSGAPRRVGYHFRPIYRGDLLTHQVPFNHYQHVIRVFLATAEALGVAVRPGDVAYPRLEPGTDARAAAARAAGAQPGERLVVLAPCVSDLGAELRRWAPEKYAALADRLAARGVRVALVGGPSDREHVARIRALAGPGDRIRDLAGALSLEELAGLLARAAVVVSSDTGPMHLAVAAGRPVIAFFGTETPTLYGPLGPGHTVIRRDLYCSPCLTVYNEKMHACPHANVCMTSIEVDEVFAATLRYVGAPAGEPALATAAPADRMGAP